MGDEDQQRVENVVVRGGVGTHGGPQGLSRETKESKRLVASDRHSHVVPSQGDPDDEHHANDDDLEGLRFAIVGIGCASRRDGEEGCDGSPQRQQRSRDTAGDDRELPQSRDDLRVGQMVQRRGGTVGRQTIRKAPNHVEIEQRGAGHADGHGCQDQPDADEDGLPIHDVIVLSCKSARSPDAMVCTHSIREPEFDERPCRPKPVSPRDLLSFLIGAAMVGNSHFVHAPPLRLEYLGRHLGLHLESL